MVSKVREDSKKTNKKKDERCFRCKKTGHYSNEWRGTACKKANKGFNMSITEEDSSVELNQGADD